MDTLDVLFDTYGISITSVFYGRLHACSSIYYQQLIVTIHAWLCDIDDGVIGVSDSPK